MGSLLVVCSHDPVLPENAVEKCMFDSLVQETALQLVNIVNMYMCNAGVHITVFPGLANIRLRQRASCPGGTTIWLQPILQSVTGGDSPRCCELCRASQIMAMRRRSSRTQLSSCSAPAAIALDH
jgi:hypothetical protein